MKREEPKPREIISYLMGGCKGMSSGAFVIDTNVSEGEHLGKVSLVE